MAEPQKKSRWRHFWRAFRWLRIGCWLAVLTVVVAFIYLNQVGLPNFAKRRVQAELRERGLDVEFERLRLRWYEGIVAEKLTLTRTNAAEGLQLSIQEAKVGLDADELRKFRFKVSSLWLRQGRLAWTLAVSNQPPRTLTVENVRTELRFGADDRWELERFTADSLGAKLSLSGVITNASAALRQRPVTVGSKPVEVQWLRWLADWERIQFTTPPELTVTLRGDGRAGGSFTADVEGWVSGARTPWGEGKGLAVRGSLTRSSGSNSTLNATARLRLAHARTEWGVASNAVVAVTLAQEHECPSTWEADWQASLVAVKTRWAEVAQATVSGHTGQRATTNEVTSTLALDATRAKTEWGTAQQVKLTAKLSGVLTNQTLLGASWEATFTEPDLRWGRAKAARINGRINARPPGFPKQADAGWGQWRELEPWQIDFAVALDGVLATNLTVAKFGAAGQWRSPDLTLTNIHAELYRGQMDGTGSLNVATRRVVVGGALDFDAHGIGPLLHPNDQRFIEQFSWERPPKLTGRAGITLAAWTNAAPNWEGELLPTLWVASRADCGPGAFRTVPWTAARTALNISNVVIELPDLFVQRPEGTTELSHRAHLLGRFFHWKGRSGIDPQAIRPLIEDDGTLVALGFFRFTQPPEIVGEVWGEHARGEPDRVGVSARVALTNFTFRGESWSNLTAVVNFTNDLILLTGVDFGRGRERLIAPESWVDLKTQTLRVTNVLSTLNPTNAVRMIGPEVVAAIAPYRFLDPPTVRVNGSLQFDTTETTDLHFEIEGGAFAWEKFRLPSFRGGVHWVTNRLTLANISGGFYGGQVEGNARFDFAKDGNADYRFTANFTGANLHQLIADLADPTNKLEGTFTGVLNITAANTADFGGWQGVGNVTLTNGLLWDAPLFGLFSPVLNTLNSGLGNSRAKEATATYLITNSVILTRDLVIRSPPLRLHYDGTVGFDGRVKARVEAELFRDAFLIGPLVSLLTTPLTKIFEYKVSGTLTEPKLEPVYIPKLFLFPLRPFKTLKELFSGSDDAPKLPEKK